MASFGGQTPKTVEQRALDSTKTQDKTFINKDFVKNMAFLNQTVDIHTEFLTKLQKGVDSANENIIEQIQGFAADLFLLFAGLEPTGIDLGDLKYVIQALGAIFGINPSTPFPLNIIEAVGHMFGTYIAPLEQFTDVVFDAISAWALDLGFDPAFLDAVKNLKESVEAFGSSIGQFFNRILSLFDIFNVFGDAFGGTSSLFAGILDFFDNLVLPSLKPVLQAISFWTVPFVNLISGSFDILTRLINGLPLGHITNKQVNIISAADFKNAADMQTGFGWSWDSSEGNTAPGCAKATANSTQRELVSGPIPVEEDQNLNVSVWIKWSGLVYVSNLPVTLNINRYMDDNFIGTSVLSGVSLPAINQAWIKHQGTYVVPGDCNIVKVSLRVNPNASSGSVWFDDVDMHKQADSLPQSWIANLVPDILGVRNFINDVIDTVITAIRGIPFVGGTLAHLLEWLTGWHDDTEDTAAVASDAKLGLQVTQNIIVGTTSAIDPSDDVTDDDVQLALAAQTDTIISQGAAIQQLLANNSSDSNSTIQIMDDFEAVNTDHMDSTLWTQYALENALTDALFATADGHNAKIIFPAGSTTDTATLMCVYTKTGFESSQSDYQKNTITIAQSLTYPGFGDGRRPNQGVYARVSDDGTTAWVHAYITNTKRLIVEYKNGGSTGVLYDSGDGAVSWPGPGSNLTLEAGIGASPRLFRVWVGTKPITTVDDSVGMVTAMGATYRRRGFGGRVAAGWIPGSFTQFNAIDGKPPTTRGCGLRVLRTNTATITKTDGYSALPANCLTVVDRIANIDWDNTNQWAIIKVDGWYSFTMQLKASRDIGADLGTGTGEQWYTSIEISSDNGTTWIPELHGWAKTGFSRGFSGSGGGTPADERERHAGPAIIPTYCNVGDLVRPVADLNTADIVGDAAGAETWFAGMLVNR